MDLTKINEMVSGTGIYTGGSIAIEILMATLLIVGFIFWIAMIVHATRHDIEYKPIWILLIFFLNIFGAIIYYFAVKKPEDCYCCYKKEDCCLDENACCLNEGEMKKTNCKKCNKCNKKVCIC